MEKYNPLKTREDKSSYCLSSKNNRNVEAFSEFNVVLTNSVFKKKNIIQDLKNSKTKLEISLINKKREYESILIKINALIDIGMESNDDKKLDEIEQLVKEHKSKKIFIQQEIDRINREISNIYLKIKNTNEENSMIQKYKLDSGGKFRSIVCPKEDEEELRDTLEGFGCLCD
jgi:predicted Zn-dependent peptidase